MELGTGVGLSLAWMIERMDAKSRLTTVDNDPKLIEIEEILNLIKVGGFYIIDDMTPQPNWPEGHQEKAEKLVTYLESRKDLNLTKMTWSTGVIVALKNQHVRTDY